MAGSDSYAARAPGRAWADALFAGWLPLIAINALFAQRMPVQLDTWRHVVRHLYDGGQILGLASITWLAVRALFRITRPLVRATVAFGLVSIVCYALLEQDLESFLERNAGSAVPWRAVFAAIGALSLAFSCAVGAGLARGRLRVLSIGLGLALGLLNHLVLELNYPGAHFVLGWSVSALARFVLLPKGR